MTIKRIQSAITRAGFNCHDGATDANEDDLDGQTGFNEEGTGVYVGECSDVRGGGFIAYYLDIDAIPGNHEGFGASPDEAIADI